MAKINTPKTSKQLAIFCAKMSAEKIAEDINVIDLQKIESATTDFFVICSTDSVNQSRAILDTILRQGKKLGLTKPKVEGELNGEWILIDFFDVVIHIMLKSIREYYDIENVWSDSIFYEYNVKTERLNKIEKSKKDKIIPV